jgi:hypothetical protein
LDINYQRSFFQNLANVVPALQRVNLLDNYRKIDLANYIAFDIRKMLDLYIEAINSEL